MSVNGKTPDEHGNLEVTIPEIEALHGKTVALEDDDQAYSLLKIIAEALGMQVGAGGSWTGKAYVSLGAFAYKNTIDVGDLTAALIAALKGEKGDQGEPGAQGQRGTDGASVTIVRTSETSESGGYNSVVFSNGIELRVRNGTAGAPGSNGADGLSITIARVSETTASGGTNTIEFSDGSVLHVKNGTDDADFQGRLTTLLGMIQGGTTAQNPLINASSATLTPEYGGNGEKFSEWTYAGIPADADDIYIEYIGAPSYEWGLSFRHNGEVFAGVTSGNGSATIVDFTCRVGGDILPPISVTATRVANPLIGYTLGSQFDKPLASEAEAEALRNSKAPLASPAFTGTPTAPTPASDDNSANVATTAFVKTAVAGKADKASNPTAGNIAALDEHGSLTDSGIASDDVATKDFVNSSIATNTATFRGTYNLVTDLGLAVTATEEQTAATIAAHLASLVPPVVPENNDYCFVRVPYNDGPVDPTHIERIDRYKCTVTTVGETTRTWVYEFSLNNSSFTEVQWSAINSGITAAKVTKLDGISAGAQVNVVETVKVNGTVLTPDASKAVDITYDASVTPSSANAVKSSGIWSAIWGTASTAFSSLYDWAVAQLAGKATKADATLTPRYADEWTLHLAGWNIESGPTWNASSEYWEVYIGTDDGEISTSYTDISSGENALTLTFGGDEYTGGPFTITRVGTTHTIIGYQLGDQENKPLASEAEAEALRDGKLDKSDVVSPSTSATTGQAADAKATGDALEPLLFAQYYPDGSVKSVAEFTAGIKYDAPDAVNRTVSVLPFCNTGAAANDNSNLSGRVVIPPFVDAQGNGYISDDGTRYKVVGVASRSGSSGNENTNLTAIIAPNTVTSIGNNAFITCTSLITVSLPAVASIGHSAFDYCTLLTSVSLPAATNIGNWAFANDWSLASVDFGANLSSVPSLGSSAFDGVPSTCKIIVPDSLYDAWIAAANWSTLYAGGYKFLRHSEWEYARKYELAGYAPLASPAFTGTPTAPTPTAGDDSTKVATTAFVQGEGANKLDSTSAAPAWVSGTAYPADALVTYNGAVYQNTSGTTIQSATTPDTPNSGWTAKKVSDLFQTKKVSGAVSGHLAGFDVNGAVQDSGIQVGVGGDGVPYIILTN